MLRARLEVLRGKLYQALEASGMDHSHPDVVEASVAFDEALNLYLRHQYAHHDQGQAASHQRRSRAGTGRLEVV